MINPVIPNPSLEAKIEQGFLVPEVARGDFREYVCPEDAVLVLTDPPYGIGKKYADKTESRPFAEWVNEIYEWSIAPRTMIFAPTPTIYEWLPLIPRPTRWLWWHRTFVQPTKGLRWWVPSLTPILVYETDEAEWHGPTRNDRNYHDVIDSHSSMADIPRLKRINAPKHPGVTGTQITKKILEPTTSKGQLVVDPMAGLGSILVGAKMLGRWFWGAEIEASYADTANRWLAATHSMSDSLFASDPSGSVA